MKELSETAADKQRPAPTKSLRRRRPMRATVLHLFEFVALLMVVALVVFGIISWQLSKGPIGLAFLQSDVEAAMIRVFGGQSATIGKLEADWSQQEKALVIVASNVQVLDVDGNTIIAMPRFEAGLDGLALLRAQLAFSRLVAVGGEVSVVRREDGAIGIGIGSIEQVLQNPRVWQRTDGIQAPILRQAISRLHVLSIRGGALNLQDFRSGIHWRAPDAQLSFKRSGKRLEFSAKGVIESNGHHSPISFEGTSRNDFSNLVATASFKDYIPAELVPDLGRLSFLNRLQFPVSSALSVATDAAGLLTHADFEVTANEGIIALDSGPIQVNSGNFEASFNATSGTILIDQASLLGPGVHMAFRGSLRGLDPARVVVGEQIDFDLDFDKIRLDLGSLMQGNTKLDDLVLQGSYLPIEQSLNLSKWKLSANKLNLSGNGKVQWVELEESNTDFVRVELNGRSNGSASLSEVLAFWPENLAEGVRSWTKKNMKSAKISDLILQLKVDEPIKEKSGLANDMLALSFSFDQVETTYFGTMPPIKNGKGTALLQGNRFDVNMTSGTLMGNALSEGYVEIPYLHPAGAVAVYGARASGELSDVLYLLDQPPFGYPTMYNIVPSNVTGTGYVDFQMHRPMRTRVPFKDMAFSAKGLYENVGAPGLVFGQDLSEVEMLFEADQNAMLIEGQGLIEDWTSKFNWSENFKADGEPRTKMSVETRIDAGLFDSLGLPTRDFFTGEIDLKLQMIGNGLMIQKGVVDLNITDASIDFAGPGWMKPVGSAGAISFQVFETTPETYAFEDVKMHAQGLNIEGRFELSADHGLQILELSKANMAGAFDFSAEIERDQHGVFQLKADVLEADISSWTGNLIRAGNSQSSVPVRADIRFKQTIAGQRLLFDDGYFLFSHNGKQIDSMEFFASSKTGEHRVSLERNQGGIQNLLAKSDDGGAVMQALFGFDGIDAGLLTVRGTMAATAEETTNISLNLQDFQLKETPVAAQILSLGSLKGFSDTLLGDGIAFNTLELPIQSRDGKIYIREARATGPAMGVTLGGDVDLTARVLKLEGVLAPAYTLNSMFRALPIVGNILVPREGEGVFGLTYSIEGHFDEMQVSVNPLSAFTPGVLRQMFGGKLPDVDLDTKGETDGQTTKEETLAEPDVVGEP